MKRKLIALTTMIFTFLALTGICQAQLGFRLKLTGGYGTMKAGDFNTFGEGFETFLGNFLTFVEFAYGPGGEKTGEFKKINWGLEYGGELIFNLAGPLGVGIGAGYIKRSKDSEFGISHASFGSITASTTPELTVIPVSLNVYLFPPSTPFLNVYVYGGVGYYIGKSTSTFRVDLELVGLPAAWEEIIGDIKDQGFGFQGGAGLEFSVVPKMAFFIEGNARSCKLKGWEGDGTYRNSLGETEQNTGTMWYYEQQDPDTGLWYPLVDISEDTPSGADVREAREFEVDLSGISIRAGIRIKF